MLIFRHSTYKLFFSLELSIGSVLELLVLKNDAECTSQRLKWTSGARVMTIFGFKNKLVHGGELVWEAQGTSLRGFPEEPGLGRARSKSLITLEPS